MTQIIESTSTARVGDITLGEVSTENVNALVDHAPYLLQEPQNSTEAIVTALGSLGDHTYRLNDPVLVDVTRDGDSYVVAWRGTDEFGYGPTVAEAIRDLQLTIIELFETLTESADAELSDSLRGLRDDLKKRILVAGK